MQKPLKRRRKRSLAKLGPLRDSFTPAQHALVEELSETIIPADSHSGGAKAAKVADYIEQVLSQTTDDNQKSTWSEGLATDRPHEPALQRKSYVDSSSEERNAVLTVLSDNEHMTDLPEVRFFRDLKHLTIRGYYTSKDRHSRRAGVQGQSDAGRICWLRRSCTKVVVIALTQVDEVHEIDDLVPVPMRARG